MSCRPALAERPLGRKGTVEADIKAEVKRRYPDWERWGLAPTDMLMAAAGPAMEIVRPLQRDPTIARRTVDISTFLPLARAAVQEAMAVEIDHQPLDAFDPARGSRCGGSDCTSRQPQAKVRAPLAGTRLLTRSAYQSGILCLAIRVCGYHLREVRGEDQPDSAIIDLALALAPRRRKALQAMGQVLVDVIGRLRRCLSLGGYPVPRGPSPRQRPRRRRIHRVLRARDGIRNAAVNAVEAARAEVARTTTENVQLRLL